MLHSRIVYPYLFQPLPSNPLQASVFMNVCYAATSGEDDGYKALTAVGLLSAIQTLVKAACDNQPVRSSACVRVCVRVCVRACVRV